MHVDVIITHFPSLFSLPFPTQLLLCSGGGYAPDFDNISRCANSRVTQNHKHVPRIFGYACALMINVTLLYGAKALPPQSRILKSAMQLIHFDDVDDQRSMASTTPPSLRRLPSLESNTPSTLATARSSDDLDDEIEFPSLTDQLVDTVDDELAMLATEFGSVAQAGD